jgi:hypothetical protein
MLGKHSTTELQILPNSIFLSSYLCSPKIKCIIYCNLSSQYPSLCQSHGLASSLVHNSLESFPLYRTLFFHMKPISALSFSILIFLILA